MLCLHLVFFIFYFFSLGINWTHWIAKVMMVQPPNKKVFFLRESITYMLCAHDNSLNRTKVSRKGLKTVRFRFGCMPLHHANLFNYFWSKMPEVHTSGVKYVLILKIGWYHSRTSSSSSPSKVRGSNQWLRSLPAFNIRGCPNVKEMFSSRFSVSFFFGKSQIF